MRADIGIVPKEVMFAFGATTFLFYKEGIVALLCEATAKTMEGSVDGLLIAMLTRVVEASTSAFVAE